MSKPAGFTGLMRTADTTVDTLLMAYLLLTKLESYPLMHSVGVTGVTENIGASAL